MGPITTKDSLDAAEKETKEAATKASASEQTDNSMARLIMPIISNVGEASKTVRKLCGRYV